VVSNSGGTNTRGVVVQQGNVKNQVNCLVQLSSELVLSGLNDGHINVHKFTNVAPETNLSFFNRQSQLVHESRPFNQETLQAELLGNYNYESYPFVALAGKSSKVIIFDAQQMTVVHSIRVLISSM
jgi:hypothetical protein